MNDDFMHGLRRDPPSELEANLREKLRRQAAGAGADAVSHAPPAPNYRPALIAAAAVLAVVAFSVSPALRVSAQAFLDLFRVRNFVAVTVDPARLEQLNSGKIDMKSLLGDHIQDLEKPGPPRVFHDAASAGLAAGMAVRVPATLPSGLVSDTVLVQGAGAARLTVDARKLREVLDALGLSDVTLPNGLDGAQVTFRMPQSVVIPYAFQSTKVVLMQAHSPEVSMPPGLDLQQLGEIGLRVAGMSAGEAHQFASNIDWRSTVLVPVPANAQSFRQVDVQGHKGLLVTTTGAAPGSEMYGRHGAVLMWSDGDKVYAVAGNTNGQDLLLLANSLH